MKEFQMTLEQPNGADFIIRYEGVEYPVEFDMHKNRQRAVVRIAGKRYAEVAPQTLVPEAGPKGDHTRLTNRRAAANAVFLEARRETETRWLAAQAKLNAWVTGQPMRF
jgi:hypothetical protein